MITKEVFADWRKSDVYQLLFADVIKQIETYGAELINRETPDTSRDQLIRGRIQGLGSVLDWQPEFVKEEEVEDAD